MKRKLPYILLLLEFAAVLSVELLTRELPQWFSSLLAFPIEQTGMALRALSRAGRWGNALSLALWALLSLLPLLPLLRSGVRGRGAESAALAALAAVLCPALYLMVNPHRLYDLFPAAGEEALPVLKALPGTAVWSVVVLWGVLRLLRLFQSGDLPRLLGYLRSLLWGLCALFTLAMATSGGAALAAALDDYGADAAVGLVRALAAALPYALDIAITLRAQTLLSAVCSGDTEGVPRLAHDFSRHCCRALGVMSAAVAGVNLLQLLLSKRLSHVAVEVSIPLYSLAFVLCALLLSRLLEENGRLREDNDLFI